MQLHLGDAPISPVGYDSMGVPIYPSGITAAQLAAASDLPVSEYVTVTPSSTTYYDPTTGQTTTSPTPQAAGSNLNGILLVSGAALLAILMAK